MTFIKAAVLAAVCSVAASASTVYFTETIANANGVLDGTAFTDETVTIVLTGNTSTITHVGGTYYDSGTATVSVSGGGTDTFTNAVEVFDDQTTHVAGIADVGGALVLDTDNAAFTTYALSTSIGPLGGGSQGNSGTSYATTGGSFKFTSPLNIDHPSDFTADLVPEPGTLGLLGSGIGLLLIRRRAAR